MLDKFPMDQIGANTLKRTTKYDWNMQADTVKTTIKKLTDTIEKHMHHFQCQQSEFKCKQVPNISDQNKQRNYRYFTFVHARTMTVKTVILYDNPTKKINNNNNALTFVSLYNFTQN